MTKPKTILVLVFFNSNLIASAKINPTYNPSLREYSPCL